MHTISCLWILAEQAKFMAVYATLLTILLALNVSPANKCQHKFQPGKIKHSANSLSFDDSQVHRCK